VCELHSVLDAVGAHAGEQYFHRHVAWTPTALVLSGKFFILDRLD
jgi:hypothetical protein